MSYLAMAKLAESQRIQYREALRRWWSAPEQSPEAEEAGQTVLWLLDDLGVQQAMTLREEELRRCDPDAE